MKEKLLRALKWSAYPAFYITCLLFFGYLTFPFDRLKDRLIAELGKQSKGKGAPVITIDSFDSYWLTGAEVEGVKIRFPQDDRSSAKKGGFGSMGGFGPGGFGAAPAAPEPESPSVIEIKEAHVRARILPLIIGRVQLDFWANIFDGEVEGTAPAGGAKGDVELQVTDIMLSKVDPLQDLLGIPISGKVNGELELSPTDGKFNKASGKLELSIKNLVVSDGKTKIQGLLAIPPAKIDEIAIAAEAEKGVLKISKLSAGGPDLELEGDGKINLREPWAESSADIYIKFRFTDAYRGKDATTKSILGDPGSTATPLIEMQVSKLKKAKRGDGFYGFHVHGRLKKLQFTPAPTETGGSKKGGKSSDPTTSAGVGKKPGGVALPGPGSPFKGRNKASPADRDDDEKADGPKEDKREDADEKGDDGPTPARPGINPRSPSFAPNVPEPPSREPPPEPTPEPAPEPPVLAAPPEPGEPPGEAPGEPPGEAPAEPPVEDAR